MKLTSNFVCLSLGALCALIPVAQVAAGGDPNQGGTPGRPGNSAGGWPAPSSSSSCSSSYSYSYSQPGPSSSTYPPPPGHGGGPGHGGDGNNGNPYGGDNKPPYGGNGNGPNGYNHPDGGDNGKPPYGGGGGGDKKPPPPQGTQVLWGQCGGYYYNGTTRCPDNAYCHKFSDWYSQCNVNGQ